jgi:hypothetical protein
VLYMAAVMFARSIELKMLSKLIRVNQKYGGRGEFVQCNGNDNKKLCSK